MCRSPDDGAVVQSSRFRERAEGDLELLVVGAYAIPEIDCADAAREEAGPMHDMADVAPEFQSVAGGIFDIEIDIRDIVVDVGDIVFHIPEYR